MSLLLSQLGGGGVSEGVGSSSGAATVTGWAPSEAVGLSEGIATVSGAGQGLANAVGLSQGLATVTGIGFGLSSMAISATFVHTSSSSEGDASHAHTSCSLGSDATDRDILVCIGMGDLSIDAINSVDIGGVGATQIVTCTGTNQRTAIWGARIPTGTNVTITLNFAGNTQRSDINVIRMVGANSITAFDTDAPAGGGSASRTNTISVQDKGVIISAESGGDSNTGWTNSTELNETSGGDLSGVAAFHATSDETDRVITANPCRCVCSAAFTPLAQGAGLSAGIATVSGVGATLLNTVGSSAGVAVATAFDGSFFNPFLNMVGNAAGLATVQGTRQGFAYPLGQSQGVAKVFGYPQGFISRLRYNGAIVPNLRYGSQSVSKVFYNGQMIFKQAVSASGAGLCAGAATVTAVGVSQVPPAVATLVASGTISAGAKTHTLNGVSFGALPGGGNKRQMVLLVSGGRNASANANEEILTATIAGLDMPRIAMAKHGGGTQSSTIGLFHKELNTDTTGTVTFTFDAGGASGSKPVGQVAWALYKVVTFGSGVGLVDVDAVSAAPDPATIGLIVNKGSAIVAGAYSRGAGDPATYAWTGLGAPTTINPGGSRAMSINSAAVQVDSSNYSITAEVTSGAPSRYNFVAASFGP